MPSSALKVLAASIALALPSLGCASAPKAPATPPPAPAAEKTAAPARPAVPPGHLLRADVDRVLVTQGPPWVLRRVLSEEVMHTNGKFSGWRLVGLPEEWKDIDLKPGDVVTRINGLPLETPDQAWEAWKSVAAATEVKISLLRDGAAKTVVLPIDGAPSPDTAKALGQEGGPRRPPPPAAPDSRSITLGGGAPDPVEAEAY